MGALAGAPRPLSVGALVMMERMVALGLEYSALPSVNVSNVQLSVWSVAGSVRVFPCGGAFFIGARAYIAPCKARSWRPCRGRWRALRTQTRNGPNHTTHVDLPRIGMLFRRLMCDARGVRVTRDHKTRIAEVASVDRAGERLVR